jgi:hypothetical protein
MSDLKAIADRVEIEALRGEFTDAVMMRDYDRLSSLLSYDGVRRMPDIPAARPESRARASRMPHASRARRDRGLDLSAA